MKKLIALSVLLWVVGCGNQASSPVAPAGAGAVTPKAAPTDGEVGNGGHGIVIGDRVYLSDLVEAGLETTATLDVDYEDGVPHPYANRLKKAVPLEGADRDLFPFKEVGAKLAQVAHADSLFALAIYKTISMYQWRFVDRDLSHLPLKGSVVKFDEGSVILVANRRGRTIYLNRPSFSRMDRVNASATIFHEALYALIQPVTVRISGTETTMVQDATRVREVVSYLYSMKGFGQLPGVSLHAMLDPIEFPRLKVPGWRSGAGDALDGKVAGGLLERSGFIYTNPDVKFVFDDKEGKEVSLHFYDVTTHAVGEMPARSFCEKALQPGSNLVSLVYSGPDEKVGSGVRLEFANYQEKEEVKTYVKFTPNQRLQGIQWPLIIMPRNLDGCVNYIETVAWDAQIRLHPDKNYFRAGNDNPNFKKGLETTLLDNPIGVIFGLDR